MAGARRSRKSLDAAASAAPILRIPHGDRIVFPVAAFTKGQVVEFYIRVAPFILPHLKDRPVTLKRFPDEAGGEFFWEKDAPAYTPDWVRRFGVMRRSRESRIHYIVIDNVQTLAWAASVGTLELHTFLHLVPHIERPTSVVFDLDPGEPANVLDCARIALMLRDLLARLELKSFAKVSGSKGVQVYVPLNTEVSYKETQPFARAVAMLMGREHPDMVVSEMERVQRKGRVFIDWSQNADYKTTVCVYSLRAKRRHPYVSAPVTWDELEQALHSRQASALYFSPDALLQRAEKLGDLFAPVLALQQHLPEAFADEHSNGQSHQAEPSPGRLLHMPAPSSQGGRRRFALWRKTSKSAARLDLNLHDATLCFELPQGIPKRLTQTLPAFSCLKRRARKPDAGDSALSEDLGVFELIEGDPQKGYLDLFFTGHKLRGEFLLQLQDQQENRWLISRPAASNSGLTFSMPVARESRPRLPQQGHITPRRERSAPRPRVSRPKDLPFALDSFPAAKPAFMPPMECKLVRTPPDQPHWLHELKLDGYRALAVKTGTTANLLSRHGQSFSQRFPAIAAALHNIPADQFVIDGEIVALDDQGRPNFQELQNSRSTRQPIIYYVFDILNYGGKDLRFAPLRDRKRLLESASKTFVDPIRIAAAVDVTAQALISQVKRLGLEGVVAKDPESIYESGKRSGRWLKYRLNEREEFVIGGYLPGPHYLDALLVGKFEGTKLMFVKKIRNGFLAATRKQVFEALQYLTIPRCPFANLPETDDRRGALDAEQMKLCVWVKPEQKCEVDFAEWTRGGRLRHAAFRQLTRRTRPRSRAV